MSFWITRLSRRSILMGAPLWAAHWSLQASLTDFFWRRQNEASRRPRDLGAHPDGVGWSYSRATARQVWCEVFYPMASFGIRAPRPGLGFGTGFGCAAANERARQ